MLEIVPFEAVHLTLFEPQSAQARYAMTMNGEIAAFAAAAFSMTAIDDEGSIIGCAGLAPSDGELVAWALFSDRLVRHARPIFEAVRAGLDLHAGRKIIAHVAPEHIKAARFAEALNFRLAGRVLHPNGTELLLYARER